VEEKKVLIIGSSISAVRSALDQANAGNKVYLLEKSPGTGGEGLVSDNSLNLEDVFNLSQWEDAKKHKNIQIISNAVLEEVHKENGVFRVKIKKTAPRIIEEKCNDCKECIKVCPINLWDDYNEGLSLRTAIDSFNTKTRTYNIIKERPVCEETCPVHLDIRGYIGLIADGNFKKSLDLIREKLPFPATIGRICPHPCEEKCNRAQVDEALRIRDLKRFVADYAIKNKTDETVPDIEENGHKAAVIGAGPAGLTCACDLSLLGYDITVFEAFSVAGGMLALGIPRYRLPRDILKREIENIKKLGVEIKTSIRIGEDLSFDDLFHQGYKAIFIAVGAHESQKARMPGEESQGVVPGVDFLRDLNLGKEVKVEDRVAVIGGGNVAMDAARSSLRLGAREVSILYRRSREEMPASDEEIEAALEEGIKIEYLVAPVEVLTNNGKVAGLKCIRMKLGEADASGRRRPISIEGSEFEIKLDMILPAIGQKSDFSFLPQDDSIAVSKWGTIVADSQSCATSREGVYAGGDCVTGPGIAIDAIAAGKIAALSIDAYLKGK